MTGDLSPPVKLRDACADLTFGPWSVSARIPVVLACRSMSAVFKLVLMGAIL